MGRTQTHERTTHDDDGGGGWVNGWVGGLRVVAHIAGGRWGEGLPPQFFFSLSLPPLARSLFLSELFAKKGGREKIRGGFYVKWMPVSEKGSNGKIKMDGRVLRVCGVDFLSCAEVSYS